MVKKVVAKPIRISQWDSCKEIIYACPECNKRTALANLLEIKYCYHCGVEFTEFYARDVTQEFADEYSNAEFEVQEQMMSDLYENLIDYNKTGGNQ